MSVLTKQPQNTNLLQPTKFLLSFNRISNTTYFCQEVNIPGISLNNIVVPTPLFDLNVSGNKLSYDTLDIKFLLDEPMLSWRGIHDWFRAIASPETFEERNRLKSLQSPNGAGYMKGYSDATLTVLSNLNNPMIRIQFINVFPIKLSSIPFNTKMSSDNILTGDASFAFEYFNFLDS